MASTVSFGFGGKAECVEYIEVEVTLPDNSLFYGHDCEISLLNVT